MRLCHVPFFTLSLALIPPTAAPAAAQAQAQGRVAGMVTDENGNHLVGARITATHRAADSAQFTATTQDDGRFAILGLTGGPWTFRAQCMDACAERNGSPRGYAPSEGPVNINQTRNPPIDFMLARLPHPLAQMLGAEAVAGIDLDFIDAQTTAADSALTDGRYREAIAGYRAVLARLPALSSLHFNIGNAYSQLNDFEAAISAFDRALTDDPGNQDVRLARARVRLASGTADTSDRQLLERAAAGLAALPEDLYNQGEQAFARGDAAGAARWYERAHQADPRWGKPIFKAALVALNKGDVDTARDYFRRVVEVDDPASQAESAQARAMLNALP